MEGTADKPLTGLAKGQRTTALTPRGTQAPCARRGHAAPPTPPPRRLPLPPPFPAARLADVNPRLDGSPGLQRASGQGPRHCRCARDELVRAPGYTDTAR